MTTAPLETAMWIGALAAARKHRAAHLEAELGELAARMLATWRALAKA